MSNFKRYGLFPFFKSDQLRDYELDGYYNNFRHSIQYIPRDTLVSFRTPEIEGSKAVPTQITARKIRIIGNTKTIIDSTNYTINIQKQELDGGSKSYYYFIQDTIDSNPVNYLEDGELYELYLDNGEGDTFISNIFIAVSLESLYVYSEIGSIITDETGSGILFE